MSQKTFIEIYKVDLELCDKIIGLYDINEHLAQPGRLGGNPRIDKSMKDSMDICIPARLYGSFKPFFELAGNILMQIRSVHPLVKALFEIAKLEKVMFRFSPDGFGSR